MKACLNKILSSKAQMFFTKFLYISVTLRADFERNWEIAIAALIIQTRLVFNGHDVRFVGAAHDICIGYSGREW
jgi:hypothetical protein